MKKIDAYNQSKEDRTITDRVTTQHNISQDDIMVGKKNLNGDMRNTEAVFCVFCGCKVFIATFHDHIKDCEERMKFKTQYQHIAAIIEDSLNNFQSPTRSHCKLKYNDRLESALDKDDPNTFDDIEMQNPLSEYSTHEISEDMIDIHSEKCHSNRTTRLKRGENPLAYSLQDILKTSNDEEVDCTSLYCSCPFCKRTFSTGNELSRHLLRCRERRNSGRKRRSLQSRYGGPKSSSNDYSCQVHTPNLQTTLITDGGRTLPGYPKISRSPTLDR
jgi:hypothetical protein